MVWFFFVRRLVVKSPASTRSVGAQWALVIRRGVTGTADARLDPVSSQLHVVIDSFDAWQTEFRTEGKGQTRLVGILACWPRWKVLSDSSAKKAGAEVSN